MLLALTPSTPSQSQALFVAEPLGVNEDGKIFHASAQLNATTSVRLDDYVSVDLEGAPNSIMQISAIWQDTDNTPQAEFRRLFRPEETFEGRKPYHGELELLLSNELLVLPLSLIQSVIRVETFSTFCHRQHFSQGVYYLTSSEYYDPHVGRVLSKSTQLLFVSPLRQKLNSLVGSRRRSSPVPLSTTLLSIQASSVAASQCSPPHAATPATLPSPQAQSAAQEHRDLSMPPPRPSLAAPPSPDSPNDLCATADESPGTKEAHLPAAAKVPVVVEKSLFAGELVPTAELVRLREEDAEVARQAMEVMNKLKRRAAAVDELLGSPERAAEVTGVARVSITKKSPRSPSKKAPPKTKPPRTALRFAVVK